jgi:peptidoglycan-associated lipoprotein
MYFKCFLLCLCLSAAACKTVQKTATTQAPTPVAQPAPAAPVAPAVAPFVQWDKKKVDLGAVKKGEKRSTFYEFTNTSAEIVKIDLVDACSCTKVEFPRGNIEPGGKGRLEVTFDSTEKDADETIDVRVIFQNTDKRGYPRMETIQYAFKLVK